MSRYKSLLYVKLFNSCLLPVTLMVFSLIFRLSYAKDQEGSISTKEIYSQLQRGTGLYYQNQYSEAVETLNRVIATKPDSKILYPALIHRGAAWGYVGHKEKALKDFEIALRIDARDPFLYYMRAVAAFATNKEFDRAIDDLNRALILRPGSSLALSIYLNRADYYAQKKEFQLARDDLNQVLRLDPHTAIDFILQLGVGAYYQNQYKWAVATLSQVISKKPDPRILYSALIHRGASWGYLGQKEKALGDFKDALEINNQDPFLYYLRAVTVFSAQKEFDRAIDGLNYSLTLQPNFPLTLSIYLSRSVFYAQKTKFGLARDDLDRAFRLDPHNKAIYATKNNLANIYAAMGDVFRRKGQYDQAHRYYCEAILLNPQNPRPFAGRAFVKLLKGDKQNAISDLQAACDLGGQNVCHILEMLQK